MKWFAVSTKIFSTTTVFNIENNKIKIKNQHIGTIFEES